MMAVEEEEVKEVLQKLQVGVIDLNTYLLLLLGKK